MTLNDTDKFLVNRTGSSYNLEAQTLMAKLQDTDLMLVNRSDTSYKITGLELKESLEPPVEIVTPTIIAPPDGAGIGGDVTYTPKTSAITSIIDSSGDQILTLTDANTYNADTDADMDTPISETFTAGQTVTGVRDQFSEELVSSTSTDSLIKFSDFMTPSTEWYNSSYASDKAFGAGAGFDAVDTPVHSYAQSNTGDIIFDCSTFPLSGEVIWSGNYASIVFEITHSGKTETVTSTGTYGGSYNYKHAFNYKNITRIVLLKSPNPAAMCRGIKYNGTVLLDNVTPYSTSSLTFGPSANMTLLAPGDEITTDAASGFVNSISGQTVEAGGVTGTWVDGATVTNNPAPAAGTLVGDASGNTMTVEPSSGAFVGGMEVINDTQATKFAPGADDLEFVGSTPTDDPLGSVNTWGDATWEVSTDSAFTAPMVGTKIITPGSNQTLEPGERGAIVLEDDTDYWARLSYNATNPALANVTSDPAVHFKTANVPDGWFSEIAASLQKWYAVQYGDGVYVAVANGGSTDAMWSTDGISWNSSTLPFLGNWLGLTYGNGKFVTAVAGNDFSAWSDDGGQTWNPVTLPEKGSFYTMAFGNNVYVAASVGKLGLGADTVNVLYSDDAIAWETANTGLGGVDCIGFGDGKFVAIDKDSGLSATSPDGVAWTATGTVPTGINWRKVKYGNGKFVAISDDASVKAIWSTDGLNWTESTVVPGSGYYGLAYGNNTWVATAGTTSDVMYSEDDADTWTASTPATLGQWYGLTYGNGKFVATGIYGSERVMWSYTGKDGSTARYYNTNTNTTMTGDAAINTFGIDPTTANLEQLNIAELTEQPSYPVAGYQAVGDKYQPIEDQSAYVEELETTITTAQDTIAEVQASIDKIRSQFGLPVTAELPQAINGFFPLYTSEVESDLVSDNSQSHEHEINGVTYYMPDTGVTLYHGTYDETTE